MIRSNTSRIVKHCSRCSLVVLYTKKGTIPPDNEILCYECKQARDNRIKKENKK